MTSTCADKLASVPARAKPHDSRAFHGIVPRRPLLSGEVHERHGALHRGTRVVRDHGVLVRGVEARCRALHHLLADLHNSGEVLFAPMSFTRVFAASWVGT